MIFNDIYPSLMSTLISTYQSYLHNLPILILSTQPYGISIVDMFGSDLSNKKSESQSFYSDPRKPLYFKPFQPLTSLFLLSIQHSPHVIVTLNKSAKLYHFLVDDFYIFLQYSILLI